MEQKIKNRLMCLLASFMAVSYTHLKTALPPFMMPDIVDQMTSTENINGANLGKQYAFMRTFSFGMNVTF